MRRVVAGFGLLLLAWLLWSGHTDPLLVGLGVASSLLVLVVARRMDVIDRETLPALAPAALLTYLPWLLWQIVLSSLHVARVILTPSLPVRSRLIRVAADQRTATGLATYANSITLTPGTLSLDVRGGRILVHALTDASARGLQDGEMNRRVCGIEERD